MMIVDRSLIVTMYRRMLGSLFSSLSDYRFYDNEEKKLIVEALQQNKNVFRYLH